MVEYPKPIVHRVKVQAAKVCGVDGASEPGAPRCDGRRTSLIHNRVDHASLLGVVDVVITLDGDYI